jgi:hypothetical protein
MWNHHSSDSHGPLRLGAIATRLGLQDDDRHLDFLQKELQGLCMPKHALLRSVGTESFELNSPFLDNLTSGSVTVVHTYYASSGHRPGADLDQRISQALGWRLQVLEAAAVKLAKRRVLEGPVPLNVVVEELVASHRHLFECSRQVCWTNLTYLTGSL